MYLALVIFMCPESFILSKLCNSYNTALSLILQVKTGKAGLRHAERILY